MSSKPRSVLAAALLLLSKGCSVSPMLHAFNATDVTITFSAYDEEYVAAPRDSVAFPLTVPIRARADGCELEYSPPYPPAEYVETGMLRAHIKVQIEPGGVLYLLEPDAEAPVATQSRPQPEGYPSTPVARGDCNWGARGAAR